MGVEYASLFQIRQTLIRALCDANSMHVVAGNCQTIVNAPLMQVLFSHSSVGLSGLPISTYVHIYTIFMFVFLSVGLCFPNLIL